MELALNSKGAAARASIVVLYTSVSVNGLRVIFVFWVNFSQLEWLDTWR
jgi:hypothetical protein